MICHQCYADGARNPEHDFRGGRTAALACCAHLETSHWEDPPTYEDPAPHIAEEHLLSGRFHFHRGSPTGHCHSISGGYAVHAHNGGLGYSLKLDELEEA